MKKRFTSFLLIIAILMSIITAMPFSAQAEENFTWEVKGWVLTITGSGEITSKPWRTSNNIKYVSKVFVDERITSLPNYSFSGFDSLYEVTMHGVSNVADEMFSNCRKLESVYDDNIETIGNEAFRTCNRLKNIRTDNIKAVGDYAFSDCTALASFNFENLETIGVYAFSGCTRFEKIVMNKVKKISNGAFKGCTRVKSVTLESAQQIENAAFADCSALEIVTISKNLSSFSAYSFAGCSSVKEFNFGEENEYFCYDDGYVYNKERNKIVYILPSLLTENPDVVINEGIEVLGNYLFYKSGITSITLPESIKVIEDYAFYSCTNITEISFPDNLESIGAYAFYECSGLNEITLPDSLVSIGNYGFAYSSGLVKINFGTGLRNIGELGFYGCSSLSGIMAVPEGIETIGKAAFQSCDSIAEFIVPASLTEFPARLTGSIPVVTFAPGSKIEVLKENSFCDGPKKIVIPKSVKKLESMCFSMADQLEEITFEQGSELEEIEQQAVFYCQNFVSFTIPDKVKTIGLSPISYCSKFTELKLLSDDSDFVIDNNFLINKKEKALVMGFNKNISSYTVPDYIEEIYSHCFYSLNNIKTLVIPNSVKKISNWGLYGANGLVNLTLPFVGTQRDVSGTAESVLGGIFGYFGVAGDVAVSGAIVQRYSDSMDTFMINGYYVPSTLRNVTITDATVIPYGAFSNCNMLTSITLPDTIKEIKPFAFYGVNQLKSINVPSGVKEIGLSAFEGCNSLSSVIYQGHSSAWDRISIKNNNTKIENAIKTYNGNNLICKPPVVSVEDIEGGKQIHMTSDDKDCFIYYTTDGSEPDQSDKLYGKPLNLSSEQNMVIKAVALKYGYASSTTAEAVVNIKKTSNPVSNTDSGVVENIGDIVLSSEENAHIYYTTDGTDPSKNGVLYTGSINCNLPFTLKMVAKKDGFADSDIVSYKYVESYVEPEIESCYVASVGKHKAYLKTDILNLDEMCNPEINYVYFRTDTPSEKTTVSAEADGGVCISGLEALTDYTFFVEIKNGDKIFTSENVSFTTTDFELPESINLSSEALKISIGDAKEIEAVVYPVIASEKEIFWSSSNPGVVYVNQQGKVFARKEGSAVITAKTKNGISAQCRVISFKKYITGEYDFSEINLATNTKVFAADGHDVWAEGGNNNFPLGYLTRWDGVVLESTNEYPSFNSSAANGYDLMYLYKEFEADYHVQNIYFLRRRQSPSDNNDIKEAIMKYGAVSASFYAGTKAKNYYCTTSSIVSPNHAVAIVGWDDTVPKEKFGYNEKGTIAAGDGAFICKNSWGENVQFGGYFYISYYDQTLGKLQESMVIPELESNKNYDNIFQYDMIGPSNKLGYQGVTYGANVFPEKDIKLTKDEVLKAVSFYTTAQNMSYEIYVVPDYKDSSSLAQTGESVKSGVLEEMGYHTLNLDKDIMLKEGTRFAVVVKLTSENPSMDANFMVEAPTINYSSKAKAGPDESFMSPDGSVWFDVGQKIDNTNVCIKAFTDDSTSFDKLFNTIGKQPSDDDFKETVLLADDNENIQLYDETEDFEDIYTGFSAAFLAFDTYLEDNDDTRTFPEKYDLSSIGQVTPVRNQYKYGTCWAFSTYASLESCLLKRAAEEKENLNIVGAKISFDESKNQLSVSSVFGTELYIVTYDGEKISDIQKYSLEEGTTDRKFDFNENQTAFIWDSNMIPICTKFRLNGK